MVFDVFEAGPVEGLICAALVLDCQVHFEKYHRGSKTISGITTDERKFLIGH